MILDALWLLTGMFLGFVIGSGRGTVDLGPHVIRKPHTGRVEENHFARAFPGERRPTE